MNNKPKYQSIKEKLIDEIKEGKFKPGDKFYTETELKEKFKVSSITVLRAVQELVQERYLVREQGRGTFVKKDIPERVIKFTELLNAPNSPVQKMVRNENEQTIVLSIQVIKNKEIALKLKIEPNSNIVHFKRVRKLGNVIWSLQNNYIPQKKIKKMDLSDTGEFTSLATKVSNELGIDVIDAKFEENISIQYPSQEFVQYILGIDKSEPVYHFVRTTFTPERGDEPFEYVETFVRWDYYSINITR